MGYRDALIGGLLLQSGFRRDANTAGWFLASAGADAADLLGGLANHGRMSRQQQLRGLGGAAIGIGVGVFGASLPWSERLRATAQTTGFELDTLTNAVVASFDLGTLYLVELPAVGGDAAQARQRFASRQIREPAARSPDPNIKVLSGMNEGVPLGLVTIDERVVAYGVGDPMLCRVVEAYARGKLKAKNAFQGAALRGLAAETEDALISAYVPGPFEAKWQSAAGGLLSIATALSAKLTATSADHAALELALHGDFAGTNAEERLRSTYMSVASSSTGTALGLGAALDVRTVTNLQNDRVALMVPLPITEIARGARAVTSGDLADIFSLSARVAPASAPTSSPESR